MFFEKTCDKMIQNVKKKRERSRCSDVASASGVLVRRD